MPGPCPFALSMARLPSRKWTTRAELLALVEFAKDLICQFPDRTKKIEDVAEMVGLSQFHLIRLFKEVYGETPGQMQSRMRLELAAELLRQGVLTGEVCRRVGYSSLPTFSRLFKVRFGVSPSRYSSTHICAI